MEIEAKFRIEDAATFAALFSLGALGPFQLEPEAAPEIQHNRYLDTADHRLRGHGFGLRVRDLGNRRVATLKGRASFTDGLYERDEWEVDVDDDRIDTWPAGDVRDRVEAVIGGAPLLPTIAVHTTRHHIYAASRGGRIAEISLDEGVISAGARDEHFRELEIELLRGAPRDEFDMLVRLLRERFALVPEARSKLARGLDLLDGK